MSVEPLGAVEALSDAHQVDQFDSGVAELDQWLRRSARVAAAAGTAATYLVCRGPKVVGYYALAMNSIGHEQAADFYRHFEFRDLDERRLWRRLTDVERALGR